MYNVQRKPSKATLERHLNCDISAAQTHSGKSEGAKLEPCEEKQSPVYFQRGTFFFFFETSLVQNQQCVLTIYSWTISTGNRVLTRGTLIGQKIK